MTPAHRVAVGRASRGPDGEHEGQPGPGLPLGAEVIAMRVGPASGERERRVADHEHRLMGQRGQRCQILRLGSGLGELGFHLPDFAAQELEQRHGRPGRRREQYGPSVQLVDGPSTEERDAADGAVTRNSDVGKQHEIAGVARILHSADHTHIQLPRDEEIIELGGRARDELAGGTDDLPVDRAVDRRAVDVADAAESHSAASTADTTGSARPPLAWACGRWEMWNVAPSGPAGRTGAATGTQSSNVRTV